MFADEWIVILQNLNLSQSQDVGALPYHSFVIPFPLSQGLSLSLELALQTAMPSDPPV